MRKYPPKTPDEIVGNESEIEICDMAIHDLAIENRDLKSRIADLEGDLREIISRSMGEVVINDYDKQWQNGYRACMRMCAEIAYRHLEDKK